ncbi:dihydrolipoamide acetyltransferase family protein [Limnochorda pilosa]|uniref:Dihydrolipoamide acetyltransferase component of pyruvate dehydrogenase complex n=1 Tax=Limnochorda pilosa TaxID=1555112 RepID=A0A0K2SI42_LIMPI|nr:dihydrolipoamide acetyltransferase family protein [Limnochorda pilosa]BAS26682.1 branched-chain alpha-keto acid dehydrogenase subunit E2 [Limnochorda pilosa]
MPVDVTMPQLGESITEGTIARWLKAVGDSVDRYEPLLEVVTDKVNAEVPSPAAGTLEAILVSEGETVPVGKVLARLRKPGEVGGERAEAGTERVEPGPSPGDPPAAAAAAGARPQPAAVAERLSHPAAASGEVAQAGNGHAGPLPRGVFSPVVRRLASEHGFDPRDVPGTGRGGRVTREDVLAFLEQRLAATALDAGAQVAGPEAGSVLVAPPAAGPAPAAASPASAPASPADVERIVPSPIRRTIAQRMVQSSQEIPHAWTMVEADVTGLVRLVGAQGERFREREGVPLTYLPFLIQAAVDALKEYPLLNASWRDGEILVHRSIHIGVPVGLEDGLIVPVIRDADQKSLAGLARELRRLVDRARAGQLTVPEVEGATFTVNNTGAFGSILSRPIINPPQAGILTLEAIVKRPVVLESDAIAVRSMVNLCLSLDHRVIDGLYAGRFLQRVKARMEAYGPETPV